MTGVMSCCGVICSGCGSYPDECAGCDEIRGKVYWTQYLEGIDACQIYDCCRNVKKLEHCGLCDKLPCKLYGQEDPTKSKEENEADHRSQIKNLRAAAGR